MTLKMHFVCCLFVSSLCFTIGPHVLDLCSLCFACGCRWRSSLSSLQGKCWWLLVSCSRTSDSPSPLLLLLYIKPRGGVSIFTIKPLQRHQTMLLCGMYPVNRWCHNWTPALVLKVASSGNENRCGGLLTAARLFVRGARACVRAAC